MHRAGQLVFENGVDAALPLHPALARERGGDDGHVEMRLAFRPGAGMPGMAAGIVDDLEPRGIECLAQLRTNAIGDETHAAPPRPCCFAAIGGAGASGAGRWALLG